MFTDRLTEWKNDKSDFIICPLLCYSNGMHKNSTKDIFLWHITETDEVLNWKARIPNMDYSSNMDYAYFHFISILVNCGFCRVTLGKVMQDSEKVNYQELLN